MPLINEANKPTCCIDGTIWLTVPMEGVTVPQWIEGQARGTMEMCSYNSRMIRRKVYFRTGSKPPEWFFADDPDKTTIK